MTTQFSEFEMASLEVTFDENPQFFIPEVEDAKSHAQPQTCVIADERASEEFLFQPRWWPGAYLREV